MAAATPTTHDAIIKHLYPDPQEVMKAMYENNVAFALLTKKFDGYGKNWHRPMRIAHTAGRSHQFPNAKANKKGSAVVEFQINIGSNYSLYSVDGRLQRQTSNNKGAFVEAFEFELESAMDAMNRNFGYEVYGNGGGSIGVIATAGISGAVITLATIDDIVKFEKNQVLNLSSDNGAPATAGVRAGQLVVSSVDRDAGTITCTGNVTAGIPAAVTGDFIFTDGDYGLGIKGFDAWIPKTAPTAGDNFFSLDRSADPTRLAGSRVNGNGLAIEEALQKAAQVAQRNGGRLTHFFLNDLNFLDLDLSLGSRRQYVDVKTDVGVGFTGVKVATGYGPIEVFADYNCPKNIGYGVDLKRWLLSGPGQWPFIDARDGGRLLREDGADAFEGRIVAYYQMETKKVTGSVRLSLALDGSGNPV
jgi:hypothetical protein